MRRHDKDYTEKHARELIRNRISTETDATHGESATILSSMNKATALSTRNRSFHVRRVTKAKPWIIGLGVAVVAWSASMLISTMNKAAVGADSRRSIFAEARSKLPGYNNKLEKGSPEWLRKREAAVNEQRRQELLALQQRQKE